MLRLAFDFIITWRETRTRPNAYKRPLQFRTIHCVSDSYLRRFSLFFKSYYTVRIRTAVLSLELLLLLPPERSESFSFLPFPLLTSLPDGVIRLFS